MSLKKLEPSEALRELSRGKVLFARMYTQGAATRHQVEEEHHLKLDTETHKVFSQGQGRHDYTSWLFDPQVEWFIEVEPRRVVFESRLCDRGIRPGFVDLTFETNYPPDLWSVPGRKVKVTIEELP